MMKLATVSLFLVFSAALTFGCGGSSETPSTSNARETKTTAKARAKAEFIKHGDAICKKADQVIYDKARRYRVVHAKELEKLGAVPAEERLIRVIVLPAVAEEAQGLEALSVPKGDEKQIRSFLAGIETAIDKARNNPYATEGEVGYGPNPFHGIDIRLREYGFEVCRILT